MSREYTPEFEQFWQNYPRVRRVKKFKAFEAWRKHVRPGIIGLVLQRGAEYALSDKGSGPYSVLPTTFINGHMWDDDPEDWDDPHAGIGPRASNNMAAAQSLLARLEGGKNHECLPPNDYLECDNPG